jgi:hypothetical protein
MAKIIDSPALRVLPVHTCIFKKSRDLYTARFFVAIMAGPYCLKL